MIMIRVWKTFLGLLMKLFWGLLMKTLLVRKFVGLSYCASEGLGRSEKNSIPETSVSLRTVFFVISEPVFRK